MINEDYVTFETAKLLKEKGFVVPYDSFRGVYINGEFLRRDPGQGFLHNIGDEIIEVCSLQMAMKWLREVHKKFIDVYSYSDSFDEFIHGWSFFIRPLKYVENIGWNWDDSFKAVTDKNMSDDKTYKTYEEACEAGIKHCLENLI